MLFATQSNGNNIKLVPAVKPVKEKVIKEPKAPKVVYDLVYKGAGKFVIASKFLEGQTENQGWVVGSDETGDYLFKTLTPEAFKNAIFLKNEKPSATFKSDALELVIDASARVDKALPIYLIPTVSGEGLESYETFLLSNSPAQDIIVEEFSDSVEDLAHVSVEEISSYDGSNLEELVDDTIYQVEVQEALATKQEELLN